MIQAFPLLKTRSRPLIQRARRLVCKGLLGYTAEQPCCACGAPAPFSCHHPRIPGTDACAGRRSSDHFVVPLCWRCHQGPGGIHHVGNELGWWLERGLDALVLGRQNHAGYLAGGMP